MQGEEIAKLVNILAGIRNVESPGRSGSAYPYAQTIYACFSEIEELIGAGFTMATICKYLEGEGVLPNGADIHSFRRAFRREVARRSRQSKSSRAKENNDTRKKSENAPKSIPPQAEPHERNVSPVPRQKQKDSRTGLQINHDNTFRIQPIDTDDLPDVEKLGL